MQGAKSKFGLLGSKVLQKIEALLNTPIEDDQWMELIKASSGVIQAVSTGAKSVHGLTRKALEKLQSIDVLDRCRLNAAEFLSVVVTHKKDQQHHISSILRSVLKFLQEIIDLMMKDYVESVESRNQPQQVEDSEYAFCASSLAKESIRRLNKVFAGGMDLVERLLVAATGLYWIPVHSLLSILSQILSLNSTQMKGKLGTLHSFELLAVLPGMQIMAWNMLHLMLSLDNKSSLCCFRKISQLVNYALQDVGNTPVEVSCSLYEATGQYLRVTGLAGVTMIHKSVIQALQYEFQASMRDNKEQNLHPLRKKAKTSGKRKKAKEIEQMAVEVEFFLNQKNQQCKSTQSDSTRRLQSQQSILELVTHFLELGANFIPLEEFKKLETLIGQICIQFRHIPGMELAVHDLLRSCILATTRYRSGLLSMGIWMFQEGSHAPSSDLRVLCRTALLNMDLLMHPRSLTMNPLSLQFNKTKVPPLEELSPGEDHPTVEESQPSQVSPQLESMELDSGDSLPDIDSGDSE
eukprot:g8651.t1